MRVTNEQIRAEIICTQRESCDGCPFYGVDNCDNLRGNDFNMYKDLLEARELIKEMREQFLVIGSLSGKTNRHIDDYGEIARAILEKTKEYAE